MTEIGLGHYLTLGAVIFSIGVIGIFLNRKNIIVTGHVNSFDSFVIALRETGERVLPGMHFSIGHDNNV